MRKRKALWSPLRLAVVLAAGLSLALFLLPQAWTAPLINLVQVLIPLQHAASVVAETVQPHDLQPETLSTEESRNLQDRLAAYEHRLASMAQRTVDLETEVAVLSGMRQWSVDGRSIGRGGQLIPARVLAEDLHPWRESRWIAAGALQGVRRDAGVASAHFSIELGESEGIRTGLAILESEMLIGIVEQVGTHSARVKLLSDPTVQMKVRTARLTAEGVVPLTSPFWLTGRGQDRMVLRDIDRRDVESGRVMVGDVVLSDPESTGLPVAMVIGRIRSIDSDRDNPLLAVAEVQSVVALSSLRKVYVYDPAGGVAP